MYITVTLIHSFVVYTVFRRRMAHGQLIRIFKSLGCVVGQTLNKEGKKIQIFQSLGVGNNAGMGRSTAEYSIYTVCRLLADYCMQ